MSADLVNSEVENEEEDGWPPMFQTWVMPFFEDEGLFAVLFAILGHVVVILAPLLLTLGRGNLAAAVPLTAAIMATQWLVRTEWSINGVGPVIKATFWTWFFSIVIAIGSGYAGLI